MSTHYDSNHSAAAAAAAAADVAARIERRWAMLAVGLVALLVGMVIYTGLHWAMMPPSRVETIRPESLHISGEFVESNLGSALEPDGSVTVRIVAQQYSFTPQCLLVPAGVPVTGLALLSAIVGFVWLPSVQRDVPFQGIWNAICSAAGVPQKWVGESHAEPSFKVSLVQVTPQLLANPTSLSIGRGATLALRCTMRHGERGISQANSPDLAGQYAVVVYKQLRDFQSGARYRRAWSSHAEYPGLRGLSRRNRQQRRQPVDRRPACGLHQVAVAGVCCRHAAQ